MDPSSGAPVLPARHDLFPCREMKDHPKVAFATEPRAPVQRPRWCSVAIVREQSLRPLTGLDSCAKDKHSPREPWPSAPPRAAEIQDSPLSENPGVRPSGLVMDALEATAWLCSYCLTVASLAARASNIDQLGRT